MWAADEAWVKFFMLAVWYQLKQLYKKMQYLAF